MTCRCKPTVWALLLALAACSQPRSLDAAASAAPGGSAMQLTSPIFSQNGNIPSPYTCDGHDTSPPLAWSGVPDDARSLALIVDDPDAPAKVWTHWVLYDLPPEVHELPEGVAATRTLDNGAAQGTNDFQRLGYGGPCPPSGTHHYRFTLYALDAKLNLPPGATKEEVLKAMERHILTQTRLTGQYARR